MSSRVRFEIKACSKKMKHRVPAMHGVGYPWFKNLSRLGYPLWYPWQKFIRIPHYDGEISNPEEKNSLNLAFETASEMISGARERSGCNRRLSRRKILRLVNGEYSRVTRSVRCWDITSGKVARRESRCGSFTSLDACECGVLTLWGDWQRRISFRTDIDGIQVDGQSCWGTASERQKRSFRIRRGDWVLYSTQRFCSWQGRRYRCSGVCGDVSWSSQSRSYGVTTSSQFGWSLRTLLESLRLCVVWRSVKDRCHVWTSALWWKVLDTLR